MLQFLLWLHTTMARACKGRNCDLMNIMELHGNCIWLCSIVGVVGMQDFSNELLQDGEEEEEEALINSIERVN